MEPELKTYSLDELYELEESIDAQKHPKRFQDIQAEIDHREQAPPILERPQLECLIDILDAGIHLVVNRLESGSYKLTLSLAYSYLVSDYKASFKMTFSASQLIKFIEALNTGSKSWHGNSDLLGANKVYVKQCSPSLCSREIYLYRRWLVIGFNIVSAQLSETIVQSLIQLDVQ